MAADDDERPLSRLAREFVYASRTTGRRRLRGLTGLVTLALAISLVVASLALVQRNQAVRDRDLLARCKAAVAAAAQETGAAISDPTLGRPQRVRAACGLQR